VGRGDLPDAPEGGGFLHSGKGLVVHAPIVDHDADENHSLSSDSCTINAGCTDLPQILRATVWSHAAAFRRGEP
jgi:hypothetical protein